MSENGILSLFKEIRGTLKYLQIRNSAEIRPETLQVSMKKLKCVKAFSVTPSGDYEKWANFLNEHSYVKLRIPIGDPVLVRESQF